MGKHYAKRHSVQGAGGYAMGQGARAGNAATRVLYGRLVGGTGKRRFGVHAPGCTEESRICASQMEECPADELHPLSLDMRATVNDTYRPTECEFEGMDDMMARLGEGDLSEEEGGPGEEEGGPGKRKREDGKPGTRAFAQQAARAAMVTGQSA